MELQWSCVTQKEEKSIGYRILELRMASGKDIILVGQQRCIDLELDILLKNKS